MGIFEDYKNKLSIKDLETSNDILVWECVATAACSCIDPNKVTSISAAGLRGASLQRLPTTLRLGTPWVVERGGCGLDRLDRDWIDLTRKCSSGGEITHSPTGNLSRGQRLTFS